MFEKLLSIVDSSVDIIVYTVSLITFFSVVLTLVLTDIPSNLASVLAYYNISSLTFYFN